MYRNFYPVAAGETQYFFGHFPDEPYGMLEYWNAGILGMKSGKRAILQYMRVDFSFKPIIPLFQHSTIPFVSEAN
jgi:hypothetical protein